MAILAKLLDTDFKFVLPCIHINFDIQTNFKVNQTQIGPYLKTPFCPSVIHQKVFFSYIFQLICLKHSESM